MTLNPTYALYGLQITKGITGFAVGNIQAELATTLQKYQNKILEVQAAMNANRITMNEINTQDASVRLSWEIQIQSASDLGSAEVAAAAAGVKGGSVNSTMRGLRRSEARAQGARKTQMQMEMRSHLEERRSNALNLASETDIKIYARPSLFSAALSVAGGVLSTYQKNQTVTKKAGPSIVQSPSATLGLAAATANTLLDNPSAFPLGPNG